jgi:hypothetical protein
MRTAPRFARPLAAGAAVALLAPAAIAFAPAASASTVATNTGDAGSTATVLSLTAAGHTVDAVVANLGASTITSPAKAAIDVVPVTLDGQKFGEQSISSGSQSVPSNNQSVLGAVGIATPDIAMQASTANGPVARLISTGHLAPSLLGISLPSVSSTLNFGSSVVGKTSDASKNVHLTGVQLPSLSDLLGALGLNINALPTSVLQSLVNNLNLATSTIKSAENAAASIATAQTAVNAANTAVNTATTNLQNALNTANGLVGGVPTVISTWIGLGSGENALINSVKVLNNAAGTALQNATTVYKAAQAALTVAQNTLTSLLNTVGSLASSLFGLLTGALDVPLLSIGDLTVGTIADAGATHVAKITGSVKGVSVLGNTLIKSTDVVSLGSSVLSAVQSKINALTSTLGSVLNNVTYGLGQLKVPTPQITLLKKTTSLAPNGGYQAAEADVIGAAVSWGALTIPQLEQVERAATPNATIVDGNLITDPISVKVADFTDAARFAPAVVTPSTPTTPSNPSSTPTLASTGMPVGVAIGALVLMLAAYGIRRLRGGVATTD